jgi:hypothetical protein
MMKGVNKLEYFAGLGIRKNEVRENLVCDLSQAGVKQALPERENTVSRRGNVMHPRAVYQSHRRSLSSTYTSHLTSACMSSRGCAEIQAANSAKKLRVLICGYVIEYYIL